MRIKFGEWETTTPEKDNYRMGCECNKLNIDDNDVIYVYGKDFNINLQTGTIDNFYKGDFGKDECNVESFRIAE